MTFEMCEGLSWAMSASHLSPTVNTSLCGHMSLQRVCLYPNSWHPALFLRSFLLFVLSFRQSRAPVRCLSLSKKCWSTFLAGGPVLNPWANQLACHRRLILPLVLKCCLSMRRGHDGEVITSKILVSHWLMHQSINNRIISWADPGLREKFASRKPLIYWFMLMMLSLFFLLTWRCSSWMRTTVGCFIYTLCLSHLRP